MRMLLVSGVAVAALPNLSEQLEINADACISTASLLCFALVGATWRLHLADGSLEPSLGPNDSGQIFHGELLAVRCC